MSAVAPRARIWEGPGGTAALVTLATVAGLILRLHHYLLAPATSDNADEFDWASAGLTLITRGKPFGWSFLSGYGAPDRYVTVANGGHYPLIHPWLDHPPLFYMLVGSWSWLWGARGIGDIDLAVTRLVPITLSTACIPLVYLLARRVLSRPPALMAAVLFAVAPATVLFGRLVESEALLAPVAVAAVLLAAIALEQPCVRRPVIAGVVVLCMAAPLIKVPGIFVPAAVAAILLLGGRQKLGLAAAGAGVAGLLAYFGYGALLDQHTLLAIFHAQKSRHSGIWGGWELLVSAAGPNPLQRVRDGWWLLGVIALGGFAVRGGRTGLVLAVPALAYVLVIQLTADQSLVPQYGWYRIAVLPLVYLAAGWLLWRAAETPTLPLAALLVVLGASSSLSLAFGSGGAEWTPPLRDLAIMTAVPVLAALAHAARARISWALSASRILMGLYLAALLAGNVMTSWNLESVYRAM